MDCQAVDIEGTLRTIWCQILEVRAIHETDDFFCLGGSSVKAVRMLGAVQDAFSVELPYDVLAERLTVAVLAAKLRELLVDVQRQSPAREHGEI